MPCHAAPHAKLVCVGVWPASPLVTRQAQFLKSQPRHGPSSCAHCVVFCHGCVMLGRALSYYAVFYSAFPKTCGPSKHHSPACTITCHAICYACLVPLLCFFMLGHVMHCAGPAQCHLQYGAAINSCNEKSEQRAHPPEANKQALLSHM